MCTALSHLSSFSTPAYQSLQHALLGYSSSTSSSAVPRGAEAVLLLAILLVSELSHVSS